jgi:hypothetical protein
MPIKNSSCNQSLIKRRWKFVTLNVKKSDTINSWLAQEYASVRFVIGEHRRVFNPHADMRAENVKLGGVFWRAIRQLGGPWTAPGKVDGQEKTRSAGGSAGFRHAVVQPDAMYWCRLPESNWRPFHYE